MNNMLEEEGMDPILAAPHFYWGSCVVCYKTNSLKRCTRCHSMFYCSPAHQKMHWKKHKVICKYLAAAAEAANQQNFFLGMKGLDKKKWILFRQNAVITCSIVLSRPLEMCEQEMFLFPRSCRFCHSVVSDNMLDCENCHVVTYCGSKHRDDHHDHHRSGGERSGSCHQLRLARLLDQYEAMVGVGMPGLPDHLDTQYYGTAEDITEFLSPDMFIQNDTKEVTKLETDWVFLTNQLSGPLTLLDQGAKHLSSLGDLEQLVVHVVGANIYEMMGIIKWEYLAHRLPNIKRLKISFIGPQLEGEAPGSQPQVPTCQDCTKIGRSLEYLVRDTKYELFVQTEEYTIPHLVLVQNCGFSEYDVNDEIEGWRDGWSGGLPSLLQSRAPESVVIFTSYTKGEADRDLDRFLQLQDEDVTVLVQTKENKMRSHRPIRDWERDQERDVFYSNQFISVVRKKLGDEVEQQMEKLKL